MNHLEYMLGLLCLRLQKDYIKIRIGLDIKCYLYKSISSYVAILKMERY